VKTFVTDEVVARVGQEARRGRMLLVQTTDLDKGEPVTWNLSEIAMHGGPYAADLFRSVLVASASIPTLFPPVLIRVERNGIVADELHVDGGTATPFFIAPEAVPMAEPTGTGERKINLYVVLNGQLESSPTTTRPRSMDVLWRSVTTNFQHTARASVALAYNLARAHDMEFKFTAIPGYYPYRGPLEMNEQTMSALFRYAERCAQLDLLWRTPKGPEAMSSSAETDGRNECPSGAAPRIANWPMAR
jgi:hypothetical protein